MSAKNRRLATLGFLGMVLLALALALSGQPALLLGVVGTAVAYAVALLVAEGGYGARIEDGLNRAEKPIGRIAFSLFVGLVVAIVGFSKS